MNVILWCSLVILISVTNSQSTSLLPGGTNVLTKYETYYVNVSTLKKQIKYRRTCTQTCTFWIICSTKCSTKSYYTWGTVYKTVSKTRAIYECKVGWKQHGNECTIPICSPACQNKGVCTSPNVCQCTSEWTGPTCNQDVNECNASSGIRHGCQETCVNFPGGYKCECPSGHFLASNGKNCTDYDECAGNVHSCEQRCLNFPGGYRCTCRPGYTLNINDNKTCDGHECVKVYSPASGAMQCSGNTTDHYCKFSCDPGYELRGSNNRSCNATGMWTGDESSCNIIHCPIARAPPNGFVYTPCTTVFRSKCIVGCFRGYFLEGSAGIMCDASGAWQPGNLTCTKTTACKRNPCQHDGLCTPLSSSRYTCDCSSTGYHGINCDIGHITTPKYPRITTGIPSPPLEFRSSPLSSGHVILTPISYDVIFTPSFLVFNSSTSRQSLTVSSKRPGIYFVRYSISGANAAEFVPPEDDVIFVDVIQNSTNQTVGNSSLQFPIGCKDVELRKCPAGNDVIISSSTEPWETTGSVTSSAGVIVVRAGKTKLPLSLLGTSFPSKARPSEEGQCKASHNYSVQQLLNFHVLTKAFLEAVDDSFPKWLTVKLRNEIDAKSFYTSDVKTQFLSGKKLRGTDVGKRQPIVDASSFSVLHSSNINVTVGNDGDILKSRDEKSRISLAVDVCSSSPLNVILRMPNNLAKLVRNSSVLRRLKRNGWELGISSIQISKTKSIQGPKGERYWDGEELIGSTVDMKGNLALVGSVRKSFTGEGLSSYLDFEGTMVVAVGDIDSILDSPLDQEWLVDLYGNLKLTMQLTVEGEKTNFTFNAAESTSFASFGGTAEPASERRIQQGLYISHNFETSPFINSRLANLVEVSSTVGGIHAFIKTKLQSNETAGQIDALNMAFRGTLKFGPLRFEDVGITLRTQATANGTLKDIALTGRGRKDVFKKYGIFQTKNLTVRIQISSQNDSESTGSFESTVQVLGFKKLVSVSIGRDGLRFYTSGKIHGLFEADLRCFSPLNSWENQKFIASGRFKTEGNSLVNSLKDVLYFYAYRVYERARKRVAAFEKTEERAKKRLQSVLPLLQEKQREFNESQAQYNISKTKLDAAEAHFKSAQRNVSQRLDRLKAHLRQLCPEAKRCPDICQAGVVCRQCKYEVVGKSKRTCLSTCYKTETRRVATKSRVVPCRRQKCHRVYLKDTLVKNTLRGTLSRLREDILSFGRRTFPKGGVTLVNERGNLFAGTAKGDVCQHSAVPGKQVDNSAKLCDSDDRNGHWDCSILAETCRTPGYRYEKYHAAYTCEKPCDRHVTTEIIPKSCCETVPCAFRTISRTCIAQNYLCNKLRMEALGKLPSNTSSEIDLLKQLEIVRRYVSYWRIETRKAEIRLTSAKNLLNLTQNTVNGLRKVYDASIESRRNISSTLAEKLNLKWMFDEKMKSLSGIEFDDATFKVVIDEGGDYLLSTRFKLRVNGTERVLSTVLDLKAVNSSLSSIANDMLALYSRETGKSLRKRRSVEDEFPSDLTTEYAEANLQKYHRQCSEFSNYEEALRDMISSLFNLTTETKLLIQNSKTSNASNSFNASEILENLFNLTEAASFGLDIDKAAYISSLSDDRIFSAANDLREEALRDGLRPLHLNSKLLFKNWFTAMENIFNGLLGNCSGFEDCVVFITDGLFEMNEASGLPGTNRVRIMIASLRNELGRFSRNPNVTFDESHEISSKILEILGDISDVKLFCANAPNITRQPKAFTEVGEGESFALSCRATGDALTYTWKLNGEFAKGQTRNTFLGSSIFVTKATTANSGNYTCVVTNRVSMETSTPALVVVHPAPHITVQPIKRLNAVKSTNSSLRCEAESTDNNVTYQWWFKAKNASVFIELAGEQYSYLNFLPVENGHEGWYFCNVSNVYASSRSTTSFVKVLKSALPVPVATLSVTLTQSEKNTTTVKRSEPVATGYEAIKSRFAELLSFYGSGNRSVNGTPDSSLAAKVEDLRIIQCNGKNDPKICQWAFQYVGRNVTGNSSRDFEQNANNVIGSLRELRTAIGRLVRAANDGVLSFDLADQRFLVEKNSIGVEAIGSACSLGRRFEKEFSCVDCTPGYYGKMDENGVATCVPCRVGSHQSNSGQSACTPCPEGFTTTQEGSFDRIQCQVICPAGTYGVITENIGRCLECPGNTYQPKTGQFACLPCPNGYVTASKGAVDISKCSPEPTTTTKRTPTPTEERERTRSTTNTDRRETTVEVPTAGALGDSDSGNSNAPMIGGVVGAVVFICLVLLILLYLGRRRNMIKKLGLTEDDKTIVVSQPLEMTSWNENPGFFDEDGGCETGQRENPIYISSMVSPMTANPVYGTNSEYVDKLGIEGIKRDSSPDFSDAAVLIVHGSVQNGDVVSHNRLNEPGPEEDSGQRREPVQPASHEVSHFGNPLYESNPRQDRLNEPGPEEDSGQRREPVQPASHEVSDFGNPLYAALQKEHARQGASVKLTDDVIDDEDV